MRVISPFLIYLPLYISLHLSISLVSLSEWGADSISRGGGGGQHKRRKKTINIQYIDKSYILVLVLIDVLSRAQLLPLFDLILICLDCSNVKYTVRVYCRASILYSVFT